MVTALCKCTSIISFLLDVELERGLNCLLQMAVDLIPDVRNMYESLFPGGEVVGEAIGLLRDSYLFLQGRIDPSDGGRALVLAFLSMAMTACIMLQRRLGNVGSLFLITLAGLSLHGAMVTLFGLPWFTYPVLDYFLKNGHTSALVATMSVLSMVVGWGRHCIPEGATLRDAMGLSLGYGSLEPPSSKWGILFFGLLLIGIVFLMMGYEV